MYLKILDQNAHLFNNKTGKIVKTYIKSCGFFDNILDISNVLKPISNTIVCLESKTANLANCYLGYIKLAIAIKNIFQDQNLMFYRKCTSIFNERFRTFDYDEYLLAYYLHPEYRAGIAGHLWTRMVESKIKKDLIYHLSIVQLDGGKLQDIDLFSEDDEKKDFDDLNKSEDSVDSEVEDQDLEIENLITLNDIGSNNNEEDINDDNNLDEELDSNEIEKFDEDKFVWEMSSGIVLKSNSRIDK
ncbi:20033_t:CDS:2 [Cetraspora pellucida]|uniref:20033_t:CDS:1 n=1 Tax=Cetraspora pellucida TaxID=1433469 RepID=A0A9N9JA13_9GLOM|nr:20033_t:CDS:2 [Cetraspora pellucida]